MSLSKIANYIGNKFVQHESPKVVCPPGELEPGRGKLILVPTLMRSGTHLLIDTIINNFPQYKRSPLYVDLDSLLREPATRDSQVKKLLEGGGYVVKTHYPQRFVHPERELFIREIVAHSTIITIERELEEVFRSTASWSNINSVAQSQEEYINSVARFKSFWNQFESLKINFSEIVKRESYSDLVDKIGNYIDAEPRNNTIYPPLPKDRLYVYFVKFLTRTLGRYSPVVNTTIRFRQTN